MINKIIADSDKECESKILRIKGYMTLIFHSVCELQDAYCSGNLEHKKIALSAFKKYKDFFINKVENQNLTTRQKLDLYYEMYEICLTILKHNHEYSKMNRTIIKATNHYLVRIMERIEKLEDKIVEIRDLENQIELKIKFIEKLKKTRHTHITIENGISFTEIMIREQLKGLSRRLNELSK